MGLFRTVSAPAEPARFSVPRALTASAQKISLSDVNQARQISERFSTSSNWQDLAWHYYDSIGEIKYAYGQVGKIMSRIRLYAAFVADRNAAPVPIDEVGEDGPDPKVVEAAIGFMEDLVFDNGATSIMSAGALNLQITGECYLGNIQEPDSPGWNVFSTSELRVGVDGNWSYRPLQSSSTAIGRIIDKSRASVGRIWLPHPRYHLEADSSLRSLLGDCEELLLLNRMNAAISKSRLNAGVLFIPDALTVSATSPDVNGEDVDEDEDTLEQALIDSMVEPIRDIDSGSAVVPLMIRGPAEMGQHVRYFNIGRDVPTQLVARTDQVKDRIMNGLDVPKEIIEGLAGVKYSNAIVISDGMYKAAIEPMAVLLADAITAVYLKPMLRAKGFTDEQLKNVVVWYDPSEVVTRPDPSSSANEGFDRKVLSARAWRTAHGFSESDAPEEDEIAMRLAIDKAQIPQEMAAGLLRQVLPGVFGAPGEEANETLSELDQLLSGQAPGGEQPSLEQGQPEQPEQTEPGQEPEQLAQAEPEPSPGGAMPPMQPVGR